MLVHEKLAAWRIKKKLTQEQAAEIIGVSQACFSDWEKGKKQPKHVNARKIETGTGGAIKAELWQ